MTTPAPVQTLPPPGKNLVVWTWTLTTADHTGAALGPNFADFVDRSVQIEGTFGGATCVLEGSNDGTNYEPITDPQGNAISKSAAALEQMTEMTLSVRPRLSAVGAGATIVVTLCARRARFHT